MSRLGISGLGILSMLVADIGWVVLYVRSAIEDEENIRYRYKPRKKD